MSNASKPDGTDPRILQPEGEDVIIASSARQSSTRRYHKPGCERIEEMVGDPQTKDVAIAKWKGMEPCQECHGDRRDRNGRARATEGPEVDRWRRALAWTDCSAAEVAAGTPLDATTIRRHARGAATAEYATPPETEPVAFDKSNGYTWRWAHLVRGDE